MKKIFKLNNSIITLNLNKNLVCKKNNLSFYQISLINEIKKYWKLPNIYLNDKKICMSIINEPILSEYIKYDQIPKLFFQSLNLSIKNIQQKISYTYNDCEKFFLKRYTRLNDWYGIFSNNKKLKFILIVKQKYKKIIKQYQNNYWISNGDFHFNNIFYPNFLIDYDNINFFPIFYDLVNFLAFEILNNIFGIKQKNVLRLQKYLRQNQINKKKYCKKKWIKNIKKIYFWFKKIINNFVFKNFILILVFRLLTMNNWTETNLFKLKYLFYLKNEKKLWLFMEKNVNFF
ncbi:hypothetical protein [Mesomycoplasma neurolyticum]|uniref:Uncharacterized protein n=1 Tax=Mesomycoplasma neurolyticum TaxID=2120 RepID=A0A449A5V5_9BACT|nr:hypothetical protein [Mesomycoplasma neurolyticum]VEU59635.1 Uncharacterised protein [Mesomycoplasma neurolyticum]